MHCGRLSEGNGIIVPLDYYEQWAGTAYSKIFESAHHFQIESNRNGRFESNLKASQVFIIAVSLPITVHLIICCDTFH